MSGLFVEVLRLCQKVGLVKLGHVALDGTKVRANASKHKAMKELEDEAKAKAEEKREEIRVQEEALAKAGNQHRGNKPKEPDDKPEAKAQRNFTDPDSRIMKDGAASIHAGCSREPILRAAPRRGSGERCAHREPQGRTTCPGTASSALVPQGCSVLGLSATCWNGGANEP